MDQESFVRYLLIMPLSTYVIRALPFALMRKNIRSRFVRSFLFYIPYTVLSAMTMPCALFAGAAPLSAAIGLLTAAFLSMKNKGLTFVAAAACAVTLLCEYIGAYLL